LATESDEQISMMEKQLEIMRENLVQLKEAKQRRKYEKRQQAAQAARAAAQAAQAAVIAARPPPPPKPPRENGSASKPVTKAPRRSSTSNAPRKRSGKQSSDDEFVAFQEVTYEMKQALAMGIGNFEGAQLQKAIDIIRKSRPDLLGVRALARAGVIATDGFSRTSPRRSSSTLTSWTPTRCSSCTTTSWARPKSSASSRRP
jgi:hypothetical protein